MNIKPSGTLVPGVAPLQRVDLDDIVARRYVRSAAVPCRLGYRLDRVEPRPVRPPAEAGW